MTEVAGESSRGSALRLHPRSAEIDASSFAFMNSFEFGGDSEQRTRLTGELNGLAGCLAPRGDPTLLQIVSDLLLWILALDDALDEGHLRGDSAELAVVIARMQRVIETPDCTIGDDPFVCSLRDIRLRLEAAAPSCVSSWVENMRGYFLAEMCLAASKASGAGKLALSDYVLLRMHAAGALVVTRLIPTVTRCPPVPLTNKRCSALAEMAAVISIWDSDLCSYAKEQDRSPRDSNLISVLHHPGEGSLQEAATSAALLRDRVMSRFRALGRSVAAEGAHRVGYVQGLTDYVHGSLYWCLHTARYRWPEQSGRCDGIKLSEHAWGDSAAADDNSAVPGDIASISWWWTTEQDCAECRS